jgi:ribosome-binding factor A
LDQVIKQKDPTGLTMESVRQQRVNKLVQKELAEIFRAESRNLFGGAFITVTQVRVSPDLGTAKVYLSIMATKDRAAIFKLVEEQKAPIRKRLGNMVGRQLRVTPELFFYIDDSLDYAMKIEELLKK